MEPVAAGLSTLRLTYDPSRLALWLFPPEKSALPSGGVYFREELRKLGAWSTMEKKSMDLMLVAIGLWSTDFLHHISAPLVGLGTGLLALLPGFGVLNVEDAKKINVLPMFFFGRRNQPCTGPRSSIIFSAAKS